MAFCTECGGANSEELQFCIHCGIKISSQKKSQEVIPNRQVVPATNVTSLTKVNSRSNKTTLLSIALGILVVALSGVVFMLVRGGATENLDPTIDGEVESPSTSPDDIDQASVAIPADAEPLEIHSWDSINTPPQYPMSEFSCDVLANSFDFDECMFSTSRRGSFAVTVKKRPSQLDNFEYFYFEVIQYVENGSTPFAAAVYSKSMRNENLEMGMGLGVTLQKLAVINGEAVIINSNIYGGPRTYSGFEIWGLNGDSAPTLFAIFNGEGMRPLAAGDYFVLTEYAYRDGEPMCCGTLTNHYRVYMQTDQWFVQKAVLDKAEADSLEMQYLETMVSTELLIEGEIPSFGDVAPEEYWIDGFEMAQPQCDGSYITIVMSAGANTIIDGLTGSPEASYLRTDITCASLSPSFSSGALKGQPIYVLFYGPYEDRYQAQGKCLELGYTKKANCYVAPLTDLESDRQLRYGPSDN